MSSRSRRILPLFHLAKKKKKKEKEERKRRRNTYETLPFLVEYLHSRAALRNPDFPSICNI